MDSAHRWFKYYSNDLWDQIGDRRVKDYPLLKGGPTQICIIIGIYLYFVIRAGPRLMESRQKFELRRFILFYNVSLAFINLWLFYNGMLCTNYGLDSLGCGQFELGKLDLNGQLSSEDNPQRAIYTGYLFFLTKIVELLDTVFFILRKKPQQVTFLHVFHHAVVPIFLYLGLKLAPGGPNAFFPLINSLIHVLMYSYYALSTFGPSIQPYLWWKRYLTRMQMIQFVLIMGNGIRVTLNKDCKFPVVFAYLQTVIALVFLVMFALFYKNRYTNRTKKTL